MNEPAVKQLSADEARTLTDEIREDFSAWWQKILTAWEGSAHLALGYDSWQIYCATEFDTEHVKLPPAERTQVVALMREAGMSTREIAAGTGLSKSGVNRIPSTVPNGTLGDGRLPSPKPKLKSVPPEPKPDVGWLKRYIDQTALGIFRFAGTSSYSECVALREALQRSLKRLDARIEALQSEEI